MATPNLYRFFKKIDPGDHKKHPGQDSLPDPDPN